MEHFAPLTIVYLIGFASPILILKFLLGDKEDDGTGCLLNLVLACVFLIILLMVYLWVRESGVLI